MMAAKLEAKTKEHKDDVINLLILISIASVVGVYLIATTVLIAKDGVFYIERAQQFASDPIKIIKGHPPGYPFLILIAYRFVTLFSSSSSAQIWIYSAQSITLLCRLLALIPLYFIGRILVGSRRSFWAVLILVILPHSAKLGCEAVREWPYILFLSMGFLGFLIGANQPKWWIWGLVGLSAGLGYLIRPESAQLLVYGFIWLTLCMLWPKLSGVSKRQIFIGLALLFVGFAIPSVPYMKCTGKIIPPKVEYIIKSFSSNTFPDKADVPKVNAVISNYNVAEIVSPNVLKALVEFFKTVGENLMWFFMLPLVIGLYNSYRGKAKREEQFLITAFVLVNVTMVVLRYCCIQLAVSKRWSLPLITFTVFYIPVGLHVVGNWLESKFPMNKQKTDNLKEKNFSWFLVLLLIGVAICLPKLVRPIRIEKQGYREAATWLRGNTAPMDIVAVPDGRMAFYAERKELIYRSGYVPGSAASIVTKVTRQIESTCRSVDAPTAAMHIVIVTKRKKSGPIEHSGNESDAFLSDLAAYTSLKRLTAHWTAEDTRDYSIYSNNITLHGKTTYVTSKYGQAFNLTNSPGDYVECRNNASLNPASSITLSAWIYPVAASKGSIITKNGPYSIEFWDDCRIRVGIHTNSPSWTFVKSTSTLSLNRWHHVAMTYDGSCIRMYIDGEMDGTPKAKSGKMTITHANVFIGYGNPGFNHHFDGLIDEVMIFKEALLPDEIKALHEMVESQTIPTFKRSANSNTMLDYWKIEKVYSSLVNERDKQKAIEIYRIE